MNFSQTIAAFSRNALAQVDEVRRVAAVELGTAIINDTPVSDEETAPGKPHGFLKGNWQTFIEAAPDTTIELRPGQEAIAELEKTAAMAIGDDTIVMRNNTVYGPRIEYEGWSHTKAPQGMVRINVARFGKVVQDAAARVKS